MYRTAMMTATLAMTTARPAGQAPGARWRPPGHSHWPRWSAAISASGEVLAGRSLTCPSPTSMSRQAPSSRRAKSAVTNGRSTASISAVASPGLK